MTQIEGEVSARWRSTIIACAVVFIVLIGLFWSTLQGMVQIWYDYETYTHGFIILPISLWLVWQKRRHLAAFTPQPSAALLPAVAIGLFVWALARLTGTLVVEQFAFVFVLIGSLAAVLGWQVAKYLAFPLLFLLFAVPMGDDLVPPMMEFTATFTVEALKLTGIPVYREGLWFSLPTGDWSVVKACSGVRYLIASVTLGVMYAYITYHTLWKRLLFILMSLVIPILANGIRAYIIVMIGHLSNMEYATGVDHLVYGWLFFGIVMFILFWIGSYWQEDEPPPQVMAPTRSMSDQSAGRKVVVVAAAALLISAGAVAGTMRAESVEVELANELIAPTGVADWVLLEEATLWPARHQPAEQKIESRYRRDGQDVQLYVILFAQQRQGREAISNQNRIADDVLRTVDLGSRTVLLGDNQIRVRRTKATIADGGTRHEHLVWQWYRVAGRELTNRYEGKAWEALARLYPGRTDGAWVAVSTPLSATEPELAEERLASFARVMAPAINAAIDAAVGVGD